jgi:hypothetical protein
LVVGPKTYITLLVLVILKINLRRK